MQPENSKLALIIHAYYPEEFREILSIVNESVDLLKLFITTPLEKEATVLNALTAFQGDYVVRVTENRGRDVLPFLDIYPSVKSEGFDLVIKVHTKRSPHLRDGESWRREMIGALLAREALSRMQAAFMNDRSLAVVGPEKQFVYIRDYIGGNSEDVGKLAKSLGISDDQVTDAGFFAGTMFAARAIALDPIFNLGFTGNDFPDEAGQVDGTLAHALERAMTFGALLLGMRVATVEDLDGDAVPNKSLQFSMRGTGGALRVTGRALERSVRLWLRGRMSK